MNDYQGCDDCNYQFLTQHDSFCPKCGNVNTKYYEINADKPEMVDSTSDPSKSDRLTARSALLDFYSDRATTLSGLLVASVFGLVTILTLAQGIINSGSLYLVYKLLTFITYAAFGLAGNYTFKRFKHYAELAHLIHTEIEKSASLDFETQAKIEGSNKIFSFNEFQQIKSKEQKLLMLKSLFDRYHFDKLYWIALVTIGLPVYLNDVLYFISLFLSLFDC